VEANVVAGVEKKDWLPLVGLTKTRVQRVGFLGAFFTDYHAGSHAAALLLQLRRHGVANVLPFS